MAVRVRKLAQEIGRSTPEVLGLLHTLGFPRYRSSEDMVADPIAAKARTAARAGMHGAPVVPEAERKRVQAVAGPAAPDLMASLVPGVLRNGKGPPAGPVKAPRRESAASPAPVAQKAAPSRPEPVAAKPDPLGLERDALKREVERLRARIAELERAEPAQAPPASTVAADAGGATLADALVARGLRGRDELARAVRALAKAQLLDPSMLEVPDPSGVADLLAARLVLFDGEVPDALSGVAGVAVSADRADLPGARALRRAIEQASEQLMLHGLRQVRAVGVPPRWHGLLRGSFDARIDLIVVPGGPRDGASAARDAAGVDLVWLWGVSGDEAAHEAWQASAVLVDGPEGLDGALRALTETLSRR